MKAIKIDVEKKQVYEVELPSDNIQYIYDQLECGTFCQAARVGPKGDHVVYVDDNGLYVPFEKIKGVFTVDGQMQPLSGHGLVMAHDDQGESKDVTMTVEEVEALVLFLPKEAIRAWLLK